MPLFSQTPTYNLKAVLKETGIKADALRMWEHRYGLPLPGRSAGGQRLYSRRDVETVRWLMARQLEGWRISQAVDQWQSLLSSGVDPLSALEVENVSALPRPALSVGPENLRAQWINACLAFDEPSAENLLDQAFGLYPLETVCLDLLQAGLREMGERWYRGQGSIQQEHFASGLAVRRLEILIAAAPRPARKETVLIGCTANEWHTFPVLMLSLLLRRQGLNVVYLGANTPSQHLVETIRQVRPELVVLVAQQLVSAASLRQAAVLLQEENLQTAYGGWIFNREPRLRGRIPAHFLGTEIGQAAALVLQLCTAPQPAPQTEPAAPDLLHAAGSFLHKRALIEYDLLENMAFKGADARRLETANDYLGNELVAALELGGMDYQQMDMEWMGNLLGDQRASAALLPLYLTEYSRAVKKHLDAAGEPITAWLDNRAQSSRTDPRA